MTGRRVLIFAVVSALLLGTVACEQAADDGATPTAETDEDGSGGETRSAELPDQPKVAIEWQNTVVDVEPTSRFREEAGGSDLAHVRTMLSLEEEPDGETAAFLKNLEGVDTEIDGRLVRMAYTFEVEERDEDEYAFEIQAPVEFAEMDKNDDVSAVVLLPREASRYENGPNYGVELEAPQDKSDDDGLVVLEAEEAPGRRITVGLYERTDPGIPPIYKYLPL